MWGAQQALCRAATRAYCAGPGLHRVLRGWRRQGVGAAGLVGRRVDGTRGFVVPAAAAAAAAAAVTGCCAGWQPADLTVLVRCDAPDAAYDESGQPSNDLAREVQEWLAQRRSTGDSSGAEGWVSQVEKAAAKSLRGKRVLVFVNPECGPKQAKDHTENIVRPMLAALGCLSVEIFETDDKHNAMELLRTADMSELDAVLVVGGSGTVNEVVQGLYYASQGSAEEFGAAQRSAREPLSMPIGIIPAGSENVLCASIAQHGATVAADTDQVVRAMLRVARMRRATVPLLLCQADDGVVLPVLSNGLRFGMEESVARNSKRATWLKLPHLTGKLAEMWAVFRAHTFEYRLSYLPAESHSSTSKGTVPDFDDWDETDGWHTVEGQFVGIGVLPQIIVAGCAPPALGTAAARAAAVSARKRKEAIDGAWLTWVFSAEGSDGVGNNRSELEELQRAYSPSVVGRQAIVASDSSDEIDEADESPQQRRLWNEKRVVAFSIECKEQKKDWKRRWSVDGETPSTHPGPVRVRGRVHTVPAMLLV